MRVVDIFTQTRCVGASGPKMKTKGKPINPFESGDSRLLPWGPH
jgi:hypothetical protein